ncbi:hypothetical protein ACFV4P_34360 [Kitasatospora sp. NPDC059795]|uniref:hypothetical protein n=1 Tax=Kitasatospora sp. NPDC059795 TaxID=3346949 RepID=UPI00364FE4D7
MPAIYRRPASRTRHYVSTTRTSRRTAGQLVDHIAVERAINGEPCPPLNAAEQHLAAVRLLALHTPMAEIARRIGADVGQVQRWRDHTPTAAHPRRTARTAR